MTTDKPSDTASAGIHAEPGDQEEVYFEGSPPSRGFIRAMVMWGLIGLILIAGGVYFALQHIGPWWIWLLMVGTGALIQCIPNLLAKSIRYRITNYRIDFERGLLSRNIDTIELWHVEDLHFHQSLLDRILRVGNITIVSRDETMPQLMVRGVPNPRPLFETLKQRVIAVKRQRGVLKVDPG